MTMVRRLPAGSAEDTRSYHDQGRAAPSAVPGGSCAGRSDCTVGTPRSASSSASAAASRRAPPTDRGPQEHHLLAGRQRAATPRGARPAPPRGRARRGRCSARALAAASEPAMLQGRRPGPAPVRAAHAAPRPGRSRAPRRALSGPARRPPTRPPAGPRDRGAGHQQPPQLLPERVVGDVAAPALRSRRCAGRGPARRRTAPQRGHQRSSSRRVASAAREGAESRSA